MPAKVGRLICAMLIAFPVGIVGFLEDAAAWIISYHPNSVDAIVDMGQGGAPDTDVQLIVALKIKEIGGFCQNPAGQSATAKGKPYTAAGFTVSLANSSDFTQDQNGHFVVNIKTSNLDIQRAFDIFNALNGKPFVNLQTTNQACPNGNWTFSGFRVTKIDSVFTYARVPSLTCGDLPSDPSCTGQKKNKVLASGKAAYNTTNCRNVSVPDLNPDGTYKKNPNGSLVMVTVQTCDFAGNPFTYCSRFPATQGPDGSIADSGLRIYYYSYPGSGHNGEQVSVDDKTFNLTDCLLWRDVNKLPNFDLSNFGTYDPDTANLVSPQQGNKDVGGLVLNSPFTTYTGECHQRGNENGSQPGSYKFTDSAPQRKICSGSTLIAGDGMCTGGSTLMDGNYTLTCP